MTEAKTGDTVKVHYKGTLDDGREFDSSEGREPLEFTLGEKQVIPGVEEAVSGMKEGDSQTVTIDPENAYGDHNPALVQTVNKSQFPEGADIQEGVQFRAQGEGGQPLVVTVVGVEGEDVTIDANHVLAGQRLTFELELVEVDEQQQ